MRESTEVQESPAGPAPEPRFRFPWRPVALFIAIVVTIAAAFYLPLPMFYEYLPGPVRDVEGLVEVGDARTYSSEGNLFMTTVSVDVEVTFAEWVQAAFDRHRQVVSKESVTRGGSLEELEREQRLEMQQSKQQAREVALTALGYTPPTGDGAEILQIVPDSPADGVLEENDVIVGVNGQPVQTTCEASQLIAASEPGGEVQLAVERGEEQRTMSIETTANPDDPEKAFVGVFMDDLNYNFDPGVNVRFKTGEIAGPSAGLMFALALYDRLTPEDLTHGEKIAGTGTIECGGVVGPIGGIQQKVAGAEAEGATIFLAPAENADDARAAAGDIKVVPVGNFQDALDFLNEL